MKRVIVLIVLFIVIVIGLLIWQDSKFHIVRTVPSTGSVSTVSPYLQVQFNEPISAQSLSIESSSNFTKSPEVSGKTLTIPFIVPLKSGQNYSITIKSVSSLKGKKIVNKVFRFKPTYIPSSQLPENQQQALLKNESRPGPAFININDLTNFGFDLNQINNIEQEVTTFKPSLKQATIDPNSITIGTYDPNNPNAHAPIVFQVSLDGTSYQASVLGNDTTDDIILTLTNSQSGTQVYQGNSAT